jgi:uncharacterized protein (TIGR03437 family)
MKFLAASLLLSSVPALAQVALNAASGAATVAPGSLVSLYGNFPLNVGVPASTVLPTEVNGFSLLLVNQKNPSSGPDTPVPLLYWGPSQINLVLPDDAVAGDELGGGQAGSVMPITAPLAVMSEAPGMFLSPTLDCSVWPFLCSQSYRRAIITTTDYAQISSGNPARPGQTLVIWCTGLGLTPTVPQISLVEANLSGITLNSTAGVVLYAGHTSFPGLDQVNFTLPGGSALVSGCTVGSYIELRVSMTSSTTAIQSNPAALPILLDSCD